MEQNETLSGTNNAQGDQTNNQSMEALLASDSLNIDLPTAGEMRKGMIASISQNQILISIGAKSEGVVAGKELEQLTEEERAGLSVGQEVNVFVISPEDNNGNVVLSLAIESASENISAGKSLAKPLGASKIFPQEIVEMISVGEEANNLEEVLVDIADNLERRTNRELDMAVRMLEPFMLLIMAAVVLFVVIALLLPILNSSGIL